VRRDSGEYHIHHIEVTEAHIASIVGWTQHSLSSSMIQANATLIEHAPDMAAALQDLLGWETVSGGWDAPCWRRAERVLEYATGARSADPVGPVRPACDMLGDVIPGSGMERGNPARPAARLSRRRDGARPRARTSVASSSAGRHRALTPGSPASGLFVQRQGGDL